MNFTNVHNLPRVLVKALEHDGYSKNTRYSATEILKSPRAIMLSKRWKNEAVVDVSDQLWRFAGQAVHAFLEKGDDEHTLTEIRLKRGTVSGEFDLYDSLEGALYDYKWVSKYVVKRADYADYRLQLNIYRAMLVAEGFPVKRLVNVLFLRDWSETMDGETIPAPIVCVEQEIMETIDGLPVLEWIDRRAAELDALWDTADNDLPPCSPEYRWAEKSMYKVFWVESKAETPRSLYATESEDAAKAECDRLNAEGKKGKTYRVDFIAGNEFKHCRYCIGRDFCNQYKEGVVLGV